MTFCKYCGRHILMTRNVDPGRFTPCDADIIRFVPNENANNIFINLDGQMQRGDYTEKGEIGYKRHLLSCKIARNTRNGPLRKRKRKKRNGPK